MGLTANIKLTLTTEATAEGDLYLTRSTMNLADYLAQFTTGAGLNQAGQVFSDRRTLLAGASENIDVVTPQARDGVGAALAFSKIKAVLIRNLSVDPGEVLKVGGNGTTAAWSSPFDGNDNAKLSVQPGGSVLLVAPSADGWPAAVTTNHLLKIENTGAAAMQYDIVLIGS